MTFVEELKDLKAKYDEEVKNSKVYKDIKARIEDVCRREAASGATYCPIDKLFLNDFVFKDYYGSFGPAPYHPDRLNDIINKVISDLGLSKDGTYITWN